MKPHTFRLFALSLFVLAGTTFCAQQGSSMQGTEAGGSNGDPDTAIRNTTSPSVNTPGQGPGAGAAPTGSYQSSGNGGQ